MDAYLQRVKKYLGYMSPEFWALLLVAIPLMIVALTRIDIINHTPNLLRGPSDPDPWLRLTLVREWLTGGNWYDHTVLRSNAPDGGISTPWTRPLDLMIAFLVKLQVDHAAIDIKLLRAAAVLPLIWMMTLLIGSFKAANHLHSRPITTLMTAALIAGMPLVWNYFARGNADHHAMLAALWAWVLAYSLRAEPRPHDPWVHGAICAVMLWISPEAIMLIGLVYAWFGLRWLVTGISLPYLANLSAATAIGSAVALMLERHPKQWLVPIYDSHSIVYVALLLLCAMVVRALTFVPATKLLYRAGAGTVAAALVTSVMIGMYPGFFHGPLAEVDPFIVSDFLPRIVEAHSLFVKKPLYILMVLALPALTLGIYAAMLRANEPLISRTHNYQLMFFLLGTLILFVTHLRWYYYLFPVLAIMLAPVLASLFEPDNRWPSRFIGNMPEAKQSIARIAIILLVFGAPTGLQKLYNPPSTARSKAINACEAKAREWIYSGQLVSMLGREPLTLYAPTNLGGEILFFTPYHIVASNYHREGPGIKYVWDALKIDDEARLRAHFINREIDAALICPDTITSKNSILMHWRLNGRTPMWVQRIKREDPILLFKIRH